MQPKRALVAACLLIGGLIATGCGSTVRAPAASSGVTDRLPGGSQQLGLQPAGAASAGPGLAWQPGATAGAQNASAATLGGENTARKLPASAGTIKVGFLLPNSNINFDATGHASSNKDFPSIVAAIVADANRHGGLAGRSIVVKPISMPDDTYSRVDQVDQHEQTECAQATQDDHDFLVVGGPVQYEASCYADAHTPLLTLTSSTSLTDGMIRGLQPWVVPDPSPDLDTMARAMVAAYAARHVISPHMAIAAPDTPADHEAVDHVLVPALKARGAGFGPGDRDVFYGENDAPSAPSEAAQSIFTWKTDSVKQVIMFDIGGAWGLFGQAGDQAGFRPTWLMDSHEEPQKLLDSGANAPPADQRDVVSAGWAPGVDVPKATYPLTESERHCLGIVNRATGTNFSSREPGYGGAATFMCQFVWLLQQALAPYAGKPLPAAAISPAVRALGDRFRPLGIPTAQFRPDKPDGLAVYRIVEYDKVHACMHYTSPWLTLRQ